MNGLITHLIKLVFLFLFLINPDKANSQVSQQWLDRFTGPQGNTDEAAQFTIDEAGNTYVTGKSLVGGGYSDMVTVKYNSSGIRQWFAKYTAHNNRNEIGVSIQVDSYSNVYVAGDDYIPFQENNITVVKYNQYGVQQWVQQYNGPLNSNDLVSNVVLDTDGNIYVGGYSYGIGTRYDFVLIKYNPAGVQQWIQRWNGTSNSDDYLKKILIASSGNIVVTGSSYDNASSSNFTTLVYNSSGNLLWIKKYNGPQNGYDELTNVKLDLQDNIYICGESAGTGPGYDYAIIKYNSGGTELWTARYNGPSSNDDIPTSLDLDVNQNVLVTGYSYTSGVYYDYATIKYDSNGVQQWVKIYNGTQNFIDKAYDIKTDESGNAYVTGQSKKYSDGTGDIVTIKYNSSGNTQWTRIYDGPGNLDDFPVQIEIDKSGFLYLIGTSFSYLFSPLCCGATDYVVLKYNTNNNFIWEARYDGVEAGVDEATSLTTDDNGNCYVTGFSFDEFSNFDYATVKYSSTGAPLWIKRYNNIDNNGIDKPSSITVDNSGNAYVTGHSQGTGSGIDIATVKYNSSGVEQWIARYNGVANGDDYASGMIVDASGNVFVTGYSDGTGSGKDYVTIKYNSSGIQQWAPRYNGTGNSNDYASSIAADLSGNIYVTGKSIGSGSLDDIVTVKYNSSGSEQWVMRYNGAGNNSDEAASISIDPSGNIIVCGKSKSASLDYDFVTIKYNSSGVQQWASLYNGTSNNDDEAHSLVTDNPGNVYVTGYSNNSGTNSDYTTIKYNSSGGQLWVSNYNGTSNGIDKASSISIDLAGNLFVTGFCNDIGTNPNYCTIKYNNNGEQKWFKKYNYIDNDSDFASIVKVDTTGNVYVTGSSKGLEGGIDFATIKYKQDKAIELKVLVEGFYNDLINRMISDSIKVYLRNTTFPYNIVDLSIEVLDSIGNGTFIFPNAQNNTSYYIVLIHRNSLETWSSSGNSFHSSSLSYDFSYSISQAYGNNLKQKGSRFCIYSGDITKDGTIDASDMSIIDNAASNFLSGYIFSDLNGDNIADGSDMSIADNNVSNFISVIRP